MATKKKASARPRFTLTAELDWIVGESLLFADPSSPFTANKVDGDPRVAVVVGENASGKSLLFRLLGARAAAAKLTPVFLSIRERSGAGSSDMSGLRRVFIYGDEQTQSTGATSARVARTAFANLDCDGGSLLGFDEPELGLSDGYASALGELIGTSARAMPDACAGLVVVTHHRGLVAALRDAYGAEPTVVRCGGDATTVDGWLAETETRSVADLDALETVALDRFRVTAKLLADV